MEELSFEALRGACRWGNCHLGKCHNTFKIRRPFKSHLIRESDKLPVKAIWTRKRVNNYCCYLITLFIVKRKLIRPKHAKSGKISFGSLRWWVRLSQALGIFVKKYQTDLFETKQFSPFIPRHECRIKDTSLTILKNGSSYRSWWQTKNFDKILFHPN